MKKIGVVISAACLTIALLCGCQKKEESAPSPQQMQAPVVQVFSASLPLALVGKTIAPGGKAYVDALNKNNMDTTITIMSEDGFDINGWAFDNSTKSTPEMVFIELASVKGGQKYYAAASRNDRDDVVKHFNEPAYKKAGYMVKAGIKSVPAGEYEINVIQIVDGNPILSPSGKKMNKKN